MKRQNQNAEQQTLMINLLKGGLPAALFLVLNDDFIPSLITITNKAKKQ